MGGQQYNFWGRLTHNIELTSDRNPDAEFNRFKIITDPKYVKKYLENAILEECGHQKRIPGIFLAEFVEHPCECLVEFNGGIPMQTSSSCFSTPATYKRETLELNIRIYLNKIGFENYDERGLRDENYLLLRAIKRFVGGEEDKGTYKGLAFWGKNVDGKNFWNNLASANQEEFFKALEERTHASMFELWADYEFENLK